MSDSTKPDFAKPFAQARWIEILPRSAACPQLPRATLLHAGPPFSGPPPAPIVNAAIQAILLENLAANAAAARELLEHGGVELRPAQDYRIATPLAQVVSASMQLFAVEQQNEICYAPIIEGSAPALRFGSPAPESLQRMRDAGAWAGRSIAPLVRQAPVTVDQVIRAAVAAGDECHARTSIANEALIAGLRGLDAGGRERLRALPAFVLPLLMAAACAALRSRRCGIEAIGGNGVEFGVRRRGEGAWHRVPGRAPSGPRFEGTATAIALAAIGDSAVIDFCGLGGQALSIAPALVTEWAGYLPADALLRRQSVIDPDTGIVDAGCVAGSGIAPLINLGILDRDGAAGLIGRGFYIPPIELFHDPRVNSESSESA
jgi:Protein of unknown function (DUF1116)